MYVLICRESGLDCDFIQGKAQEELLKNSANYVIEKHGMRADDIYIKDITVNLLCYSFNEENN